MARYDILMCDVKALTNNTVILNRMIMNLRNHTNIKNARAVVDVSSGLLLQSEVLSNSIIQNYKARCINKDQYITLINELENAKSVLAMLGLEE